MHICIYEADRPSEALQPRFGTYAQMFQDWLGAALPEARFSLAHLAGGEAPPPPGSVDGVLITGARAGVPDGLDWVARLMDHLRDLRAARVAVAGICFGHQVMAQAWGGRVDRAACGWTIGRHLHAPTPDGQAVFGTMPLACVSVHQDQVIDPPPGVRVLLASDRSPHGAFRYDFPAMSVQFHPEFGGDYVEAVLESGLGLRFADDLVAGAREGLHERLDGAIVAEGFARFFRETIGRRG
ncbi:type 1 glutamine amidotransferase [Aliigemmobacter aestuarii]|uniref:Type 1 glutamine amidotransferase n=1 Tax=Aliigemmobacter aestuarii TaxID=1445661 RepID=A0A4S3MJ36_9RHOB|nr:type 1 glutamine amidotransferase [Gemmobacter aestuarii]THD81387.1 type 1 glutamine amidotransferase [Gemmobacter aestuarii]